MDQTVKKYQQLKQKRDNANIEKAKLEANIEITKSQIASLEQELFTLANATTIEEVVDKVNKLEAKINESIAEAEALLNK